MSRAILHLATEEVMNKSAFAKFIPKALGSARNALKPKPGSIGAMPVGQAASLGANKVRGMGGYLLPALGAGAIGHQAFIADPVNQTHLQDAFNKSYLAAHNKIGNNLAQGGPLQSLFLKFDPSLAYQRISQATGAAMPGYPAGQPASPYGNMQAPATTAQMYNQTTRNF